jgi:DNA repair protein RadC
MNCETKIIDEPPDEIIINSSSDVYKIISEYADSRQEMFILITLKNSSTIIKTHVIFIGTAYQVYSSAREVFYKAIMDNASRIILCHNHPSGSLEPSESDLKTADSYYKLGSLMGITVQEQFIFTKYGYTLIKPDFDSLKKFNEEFKAIL